MTEGRDLFSCGERRSNTEEALGRGKPSRHQESRAAAKNAEEKEGTLLSQNLKLQKESFA